MSEITWKSGTRGVSGRLTLTALPPPARQPTPEELAQVAALLNKGERHADLVAMLRTVIDLQRTIVEITEPHAPTTARPLAELLSMMEEALAAETSS